MISAPESENEQSRIAKLVQYEILDSAAEENFDDLTRLASAICETEISLISLVDAGRQWFKSKVGLAADETPRSIAFCSHAILQDKVFVIENALNDERFFDNPLVTGSPDIRFYAGAPLVTPDGHALGTLCVIDSHPMSLSSEKRDALTILAKQVVSQLELRIQKKRLERINEEREQMFSTIAHDLRGPFNGIIGLSQLLVNVRNDPKEAEEFAKSILLSSMQVYQLLDELLQWTATRLESNKVNIAKQPIKPLINSCLDIYKHALEAKGILINLAVDENLMVAADDVLCKTILRNLIANAIKYSPENSEIQVYAKLIDGVIEITVSDLGDGISDELKSTLFKQHVESRQGTHGESGNGLGLSLCAHFCAMQKGKIWAQDNKPNGTAMKFCLPSYVHH